jgi:uncharacterized protein YbbK (DUF523 family)
MDGRSAPPLRLGASACLLGEDVRYDGTNKRDAALLEALAGRVEWVPVCPEAEFGLGVPRPIIRLERHDDGVRVTQPDSSRDLTDEFDAWCDARVAALQLSELDGFVLKARSPSCGLSHVKSYLPDGTDERANGVGRFAAALQRADVALPVIDEAGFADSATREAFLADAAGRRDRRAASGSGPSQA